MKTKLVFTILATIVLMTSIIAASMLIPRSDKANPNEEASITPPGLEKVVFIHYKKGYGRVCDYDGICDPEENPSCADCEKDKANGEEESTCYALLDRWAKWKELPIDYVIDPDNPDGLIEGFVTNAISAGAEEWDAHTTTELFGSYSIDYSSSWDSNAPDGRNELLFGDYSEEGVIAVTVIWGYFGGRPSARRIVEFDVLFDTDFTWGDAEGNLAVMDLQNIATHEIGHGAGLGDLYDTVCAEETMYGYSDYGEIKKRDLNTGDMTGIQKLYS